ncbi:hypothetical protein GPY61_05555 [Massilia sp. NEAU-DD11]|uniref:N-acetylmuramoyl-L-alanine amidase domain-containing protein n=1 Tax=Massilia cellulosiltytica TaxID=2683234 RepID=A0A7X3K651_9BURK|nr:N-acetylmuramoyl-L-alanine amidase [Telluria cellulosilytica]MVW59388.1 hypothetical protein [Telluria cellulosilytica]
MYSCLPVENHGWATEERNMAADVYLQIDGVNGESNDDSIGIEIVGAVVAGKSRNPAEQGVYETVNERQNASLQWLIAELTSTFGVPMSEIFRHPVVSRKNPTEGESASW